jgi:hypothetical protein
LAAFFSGTVAASGHGTCRERAIGAKRIGKALSSFPRLKFIGRADEEKRRRAFRNAQPTSEGENT